jgi:dihydroorotate dehydrogenase
MPTQLASALMPVLRHVDPERAHNLALTALRLGVAGHSRAVDEPALAIEALGINFTNPIGLAAGFDKNAVALRGLARLGFGFIEAGTVTSRPQLGNPRPRLFRLTADRAVINRMGFNNHGIEQFLERIRNSLPLAVPIGANLGINKEGAVPERDYSDLIAAVAPYVHYVAINVSSPNTPGLRDLQDVVRLRGVLSAIHENVRQRPPLLVKIGPDLSPNSLRAVVETCVHAGVDGLIISNTTLSRPAGLQSEFSRESGGLSGAPLFRISTALLAHAYLAARNRLSLIGVGGISSGADALVKIQAGASLVQVFTSFAYAGPALIPRLKSELASALRKAGFPSVKDAVGTDARRLAETL